MANPVKASTPRVPSVPMGRRSWAQRLKGLAKSLNTGRYSVARLEAFQAHRHTVTWWWKLLVVLATPMPMYVVAMLLNLIPLVSPTKGLKANYGFFVRNFLASLVFVQGGKWQREFFLQWQSTWQMSVVYLLVTSCLHTSFYVVFPMMFHRFPVPFCPLVGMGLSILLAIVLLNCMMRRTRRKTMVVANPDTVSTQATPLLVARYKRLLVFEFALFFVYSGFAFVFRRLSGVQQALLALLLLPIKVALSRVANLLVAHVEDVAAETVVFAVEFFNSMYVSICMGGVTSLWASMALIGFDFVHMGIVLMEMNLRARTLVEIHAKNRETCESDDRPDLVGSCIKFAHANRDRLLRSGIRFAPSNGLSFRAPHNFLVVRVRHQVEPSHKDRCVLSSNALTMTKHGPFVKEMLEFMFLMEKIVLIEYIEAFTPIFYAYLATTFYSSNRGYFYGILELDPSSMQTAIRNILLYGLLEWLSLMVLLGTIKRRFGLNAFDMLAFVLETHVYNVQGKIIMFLMVIVSFPLVHYGMDFNFRFEFTTRV